MPFHSNVIGEDPNKLTTIKT